MNRISLAIIIGVNLSLGIQLSVMGQASTPQDTTESSLEIQETTDPISPTDSSATVNTQVVLKRWEFWTALASVTVPGVFSIILGLLRRKDEPEDQQKTLPWATIFLAVWITIIAIVGIVILNQRVASSTASVDHSDLGRIVSQILSSEAQKDSLIRSLTDKIGSLSDSVGTYDSQWRKLRDDVEKTLADTKALSDAARATRERLPTEAYLLSNYSDLQAKFHDMSLKQQKIEGQINDVSTRPIVSPLIWILLSVLALLTSTILYFLYRVSHMKYRMEDLESALRHYRG